ncbi:MAG: hypothetical protein ABI977_10175 [Acidobacteriota bacterium]
MQTMTGTLQPVMNASVLARTVLYSLPDMLREGKVEITFPKFQFSLSGLLLEFSPATGSQQVTVKIAVDESVSMICALSRNPVNDLPVTEIEATVYFQRANDWEVDQARVDFVVSSLQALLGLARTVQLRIPTLQKEIQLSFTTQVEEISQALRNRQLAHRLMVIERAFNWYPADSFGMIPVNTLTLAYRAITDRSFDWPFSQEAFPYQATEQAKLLLTGADQPNDCRLNLSNYDVELLGKNLSFGRAVVTVKDAVVANVEGLYRELEKLDGHEFQVLIKSLTGRATYQFPDAPRLELDAWDEHITSLINLEDKLDELFFEAGNRLAASTLTGLTELEKTAITEPFILNGEAFVDPIGLGEN